MPSTHVRPFHRRDRDQLTALVNAHAAAVVPGAGASVATVLSHLERQPGETITDPWVAERVTLVAEQHHALVAAAHLLHYFADDRAGASCRGSGAIRWLLFWPGAPPAIPTGATPPRRPEPCSPPASASSGTGVSPARTPTATCPCRACTGYPSSGRTSATCTGGAASRPPGPPRWCTCARVEELPHPGQPPLAGLATRRSVGMNGTRLSAVLDGQVAGHIEVGIFEGGERLPRHGGWADIGDLHVAPDYRRRGVATWLLAQAGWWLRLAQVSRVLDYAALGTDPAGQDYTGYRAFLAASGFTELTRTQRGWTRSTPQR